MEKTKAAVSKSKTPSKPRRRADAICYVLLIADRGFYGFGGFHGDFEMKKADSGKPEAA